MLCLSGFELYPRWVPLESERRYFSILRRTLLPLHSMYDRTWLTQTESDQNRGIYFPCWNDVAKSHKGDKGANYRMRLGCFDLTVPDNA